MLLNNLCFEPTVSELFIFDSLLCIACNTLSSVIILLIDHKVNYAANDKSTDGAGNDLRCRKSVLVAALCRVLARKGVNVAPFKPQNMALNSAVTADGGEIGRAQYVQAMAANIPASFDMNPVLLKPNTDMGAQVIVQGKAVADMNAIGYQSYKEFALPLLWTHSKSYNNSLIPSLSKGGKPSRSQSA